MMCPSPHPAGGAGSMDEQESLNALIIEFYEKLSSWEHDVVRESGLTLPQVHTLEVLGQAPPMRMKDLAAKMGVTTGTLTMTVDRLEQRALIRRAPHASDRRSILVGLTDKGRELFQQHHNLHLGLTAELAATLSEAETQSLCAILAKLNQGF